MSQQANGRPNRKGLSKLDPGGALKNSHSERADGLRVLDIDNAIGCFWSRAEVVYDASQSVTEATFFYDKSKGCYSVTVVGDTAGSLNNKYFLLNTGQNKKLYYVWYNVGSTGTDPAVAGREGIEVPVAFNDTADFVALASKIILDMKDEIVVKTINGQLIIDNVDFGASSIADFNTGFTFSTKQEGVSEEVGFLEFPSLSNQRYVYNLYEKTFEILDDTPVEAVVENLTGQTPNVVNLAVALANTEVSIPLPDGTRRFIVKVRETDTKLKVKYAAGGDFIQLKRNVSYSEDSLDTVGTTLYFETNKNGKTVELIYWT